MFSQRVNATPRSSILLEQIDQVCLDHFNTPFVLAKENKLMFFRMGSDIWTIGFRTQEPLDALIGTINNIFDGLAFDLKNGKHLSQLEEFRDFNWEILPEGLEILNRLNTKFKLYVRITDKSAEIVEKFLRNQSKNNVLHRQGKTFHILYFDNASLVLRAKLMFPNIDKIEHYINVDELGEANE